MGINNIIKISKNRKNIFTQNNCSIIIKTEHMFDEEGKIMKSMVFVGTVKELREYLNQWKKTSSKKIR